MYSYTTSVFSRNFSGFLSNVVLGIFLEALRKPIEPKGEVKAGYEGLHNACRLYGISGIRERLRRQ